MNHLFFKTFPLLIIFLIQSCSSKTGTEAEAVNNDVSQNELPAMEIRYLNGRTQSAKELGDNVMLIFFQPDCDHCQREARQMEANLEAFNDYTLYFISSNSPEEIETFANEYNLTGKRNVHFATATVEAVISNFGPIAAPSIYIYTKNGKLHKAFNGETDINVLAESLNEAL